MDGGLSDNALTDDPLSLIQRHILCYGGPNNNDHRGTPGHQKHSSTVRLNPSFPTIRILCAYLHANETEWNNCMSLLPTPDCDFDTQQTRFSPTNCLLILMLQSHCTYPSHSLE